MQFVKSIGAGDVTLDQEGKKVRFHKRSLYSQPTLVARCSLAPSANNPNPIKHTHATLDYQVVHQTADSHHRPIAVLLSLF